MMAYENEKGFSLLEVLMIVVIIAALSAIAMLGYQGIRQTTFENVVRQDVRNAGAACEGYFVDHQVYPSFGPFTSVGGVNVFDIGPNYSIKVSQDVTIQGVVSKSGTSLVITGSHPGATKKVLYTSQVGL